MERESSVRVALQCRFVRMVCALVETHDQNCSRRSVVFQKTPDLAHCNPCSTINGEAVSTRTDGRESDRLQIVILCHPKSVAIARGKEFIFTVIAASPDRTDRVNHMPRREPVTGCHLSLSRSTAIEFSTLLEKCRPRSAVNRAVDTASAEQGVVGSIYDGVYVQLRDIALMYLDAASLHFLNSPAPKAT